MIEVTGKYTNAKIMIDSIEPSCMSQIVGFINLPQFDRPVAIMPDTHAGAGCVVGFTMPLGDKIVPNVIGVDIGCGMLAFNVGKSLPVPLEVLDREIRIRVPFGPRIHETLPELSKEEFWRQVHVAARPICTIEEGYYNFPDYCDEWFEDKCNVFGCSPERVWLALGTLGGGNHFIETGIDLNGDYWITIHSGSRNLGKRICDYWQKEAARPCPQAMQRSPKGCEYLSHGRAIDYLYDMVVGQVYAATNRRLIKETILDILGDPTMSETIESVHNYIDFKDFIIRKGAIRSYIGEKMVIPFNMRDGILICEGKSNPEWNYSAPHGAGRVMSRSQAKQQIALEDFQAQMDGIFSTSVGAGTLDEAPDAYKSAALIGEAICPTATIVNRIRPVHNMKSEG